MMRYFSVCSGIEAATVAWHPLGWVPVGFAEIEAFPSRVLAHHYGSNMPGEPLSKNGVPNHGDFTTLIDDPPDCDVLVGGTPCQAFSIAGKRLSLADDRGNLSLQYVRLAHAIAARRSGRSFCAVWENVPGVLSTADNAFGCFLGGLVGADDALHSPADGGRWPSVGMAAGPRARLAWRVLDAQYFGLAQRRKRVFLVASFGNGIDPAAVLFEPKGLRGNPSTRRKEGKGVAGTLSARSTGGGGLGTDLDLDGGLIAPTLTAAYADKQGLDNQHIDAGGACSSPHLAMCLNAGAMGRQDAESETLIATTGGVFDVAHTLLAKPNDSRAADLDTYITHSLRAEGFDASEDGTGRGTPLVAGTICKDSFAGGYGGRPEGAANGHFLPVAYRTTGNDGARETGDRTDALTTSTDPTSHVLAFVQNTRDEVRLMGGDGDIVGALAAEPGAKQQCYLAFALRGREGGADVELSGDQVGALRAANGGSSRDYVAGPAVRRLTPRECERLQGFPDDYTLIPIRNGMAADGPRYKALGNSMAVPVMRWIGERIAAQTGGEA